MGKVFVRQSDRVNERNAMDKLVRWFNTKFGNATKTYSGSTGAVMDAFDFKIALNGADAGVVEYKRRGGPAARYWDEGWHISKKKIAALRAVGLPVLLAFEWDDGLYIGKLDALAILGEEMGGRRDRGATNDWEEMIRFSPVTFQKIVI